MDEFDREIAAATRRALARCKKLGVLPWWREKLGCPPLKYLLIELAGAAVGERRRADQLCDVFGVKKVSLFGEEQCRAS